MKPAILFTVILLFVVIQTAHAQAVSVSATVSGTGVTSGGSTPLAQAAAALTPGVWTEFTAAENASWNGGVALQLGAGYIGTDNAITWSDRILWSPNAGTMGFYFVGGGHCGNQDGGGCGQSKEVLRYLDATNTWNVTFRDGSHTYQTPAMNTNSSSDGGIYYWNIGFSTQIDYYNLSTQSWTYNVNTIPFAPQHCCQAAEFFPDRNSMMVFDADAGIFEYNFTTRGWSACLINTNSSCGAPRTATMAGIGSTVPAWGRYDSLNHRMLFGGNTSVYALSSTLVLTTLASSPFTMAVVDTGSPVAYDPSSGKLVSFDSAGNTFTSDGTSWVNAGASPFPNPISAGLACGNSPTYQVIMCFYAGTESKSLTTNTRIYLYRTSNVINGFINRASGINVPGGTSSIVSSNNFSAINPPQTGTPPIDTWTTGTRDDFYIYRPGSVARDCNVTAEGIPNVCALRYTMLPGYSIGDPGWYIWNFRNPGDAAGLFGNGQEFYVQYQERIDNMAAPGAYTGTQGNGFKLDLITEADSPTFNSRNCTNNPAQLTVIQNDTNSPFPGAFINCGFSGGTTAFAQSGYQTFQLPISGNFLDQVASGCAHYTDVGHTQYPMGDPTCWNFVNSEWFTVQVHYKIGAFNSPNSVVDIWFAHNGQPARLLQQAADANIPNDNTGPVNRYGRIVLLPYNTSSTANVSGAFYYGDLIVSTRRIPDPLVSTPNAPDSLSLAVAAGRVTLNWRVNSQNGTPQDDTGFLIERCTGNYAACFPAPQSGFVQIATTATGAATYQDNTPVAGTTYTYRIRARNVNGNSGYAASICFNGGTTCGGQVVAQ